MPKRAGEEVGILVNSGVGYGRALTDDSENADGGGASPRRALEKRPTVLAMWSWSKYFGTHPESPKLCYYVLSLSLFIMALYSFATLARQIISSPLQQVASGRQVPYITHRNIGPHGRAFHGLLEERTGEGVSTARSLPAQNSDELSARAEHICGERDGEHVDFEPDIFTIRSCQVTALRFPLAGVHSDADLIDTHVVMEMAGEPALVPPVRPSATAELTVRIHADKALESLPLRTTIAREDITSRYLTSSFVEWTVPEQRPHNTVQTPDLSPIFKELQQVPGWSEMRTVTLVFLPVPVEVRVAGQLVTREFLLPDNRMASLAATLDLVFKCLHYCLMLPMMLYQLRTTEGLFELRLHGAGSKTKMRTIRGMDIGLDRSELSGRDRLEAHPLPLRQRRCPGHPTASLVGIIVLFIIMLFINVVLRIRVHGVWFFGEASEEWGSGYRVLAIVDIAVGAAAAIVTPLLLLWTTAFALSCEHAAAAIFHTVAKFVRPKDTLLEMVVAFHDTHQGEENGGWDEAVSDLPLNWQQNTAARPKQIKEKDDRTEDTPYCKAFDWTGTYAELQACGRELQAHSAYGDLSQDLLTEDWETFSQQRWLRGILDVEYISSHGCFRT